MAAAKKKVVARKATNQVIIPADAAVPDYINQQGNRGSENVEMNDLVIPRLELVQALSPCLKKRDPGHIEGIKDGDFFNSVTRKNYGSQVLFIPVVFRKEYLVWKARQHGGGFGGAHPTPAAARERIMEEESPDQWDVNETAQQFGLLVNADGSFEEIVISMARTKLKVSRQLNSLVRINGGDRFSRVYRVSSVEESSDKGDFNNLKIETAGFPTKDVYIAAETLYDSVTSGDRIIEADHSTDDEVTQTEEEAQFA